MMVSTKGRYALRIMIDLAQHASQGYVSLKDVAGRQEMSMKYIEMIVALLHKGGLVESLRGKNGGYRLARDAQTITAAEILQLTEGSLAPVMCLERGGNPCDRAENCLTLPMWQQLDGLIEDYLSGICLDALANGRIKNENGVKK